MKTIKIADYKIIHDIPPVLSKDSRVAIDTEFVGMDDKRLHRPTGEFACATFYFGTDEVYIVEDVRDLEKAFQNIEEAGHIYHNAKFDIFHLRRFIFLPQRRKLWDTMLVEQVMYSGLYDNFGLADCVRRHLDMYMGKETREEFSNHIGKMTQEQVEYACKDVIATYGVYKSQLSKMDEDDLYVWKTIELPFLWVILGMGGVKLDVPAWTKLAEDNERRAVEVQAKYGKEVPKIGKTGKELKTKVWEGVNLASPTQVKARLASIGYKLDGTGEEYITPLVERCEFAKDLLDFRTASKHSSTYGLDYVDKYVEADGRIYSDLFQMGAATGRSSCRAPNLQNQPHDGHYRECYIADDDKELVIGDWSAQEPKFAAFLCGDTALTDALNSKEKLYIRIARDAMGIEIQKGSLEYSAMKSTILGLIYGMAAKGLADRIGVAEDAAQGYINAIFTAYPKLYEWVTRSQSQFKEYVTSVNGRKIWLNEYTNQWRRAILNYPIQSSAADAMKVAAYKLLTEWHGKFYTNTVLRLLVHDEVVCEVEKDKVEEFTVLMGKVMVEVAESMHQGVKGAVEIGHGHSWASKA